MRDSHLRQGGWHRLMSALGLALATVLVPSAAPYAGVVTLTTTTSAVTLTEGGSQLLTYTFTNGLTVSVTLGSGANTTGGPVTGDSTDVITSAPFANPITCSSGESIGAGGSCVFSLLFGTDSPVGETDFDSGTQLLTTVVDYTPSGGTATSVNDAVMFTVNDPSAVPEPTSLVLLGTALAGLGLLRRRRPKRGMRASELMH